MKKLIDAINENRWMKLLINILSIAPIIGWVRNNLIVSDMTIDADNIDVFGLVTAVLTTALLLLAFATSRTTWTKLKDAQKSFSGYKAASRLINHYRIYKIYTRDGLGVQYYDNNLKNKDFSEKFKEECQFVFKKLQNDNTKSSLYDITVLMSDVYGVEQKTIEELIKS